MTKGIKRKVGLAVLLTVVLAACFALFMLTACGETEANVGTITLNKTELTLIEGADETLVADTSNKEATVTWETSDKTVATVSTKGKVTAKVPGTATITAKISDEVKATCTVTVVADTRTVTITGAPEAAVDVQTTSTIKLGATVSDGSSVTWSSDSEVATVDSEGNVTFVKTTARTAEVTITAKISGGNVSDSVKITVNNNYPEDYAVLEKNSTKANLISDFDKWCYFIKSAHAGRLQNADKYCGGNVPYFADGKLTFEFTSAEKGEDTDVSQYEFRYQPGAKAGLALGDVYNVTFTVSTTVAGDIHVVKGGAGRTDLGNITYLEGKELTELTGEEDFDIDVGEKTVTITGCVVDDKSDPLAIRPRVFGDNVLVCVYNVTFEKIGHVDSIGGSDEEANPDSYTLKKASNNNGTSATASAATAYKGQWSYYLSNDGVKAGCALKEGTHDADTNTTTVTYTNFSAGNVRLYYAPKEAEGTEITITFKIAMSVDGSIAIKDGGVTHDALTMAAGVEQEVELKLTVLGDVKGGAIFFDPSLAEDADISEVTFTITEFTVTAA